MNQAQVPQSEEWSILLNGMADELLSAEQEQRLVELLRIDAGFRREYVRFCQLLTQLHWQLSAEPAASQHPVNRGVPNNSTRSSRTGWLSWMAGATVLAFAVAWLSWWHSADDAPGRVVRVSGRVGVVRSGAPIWLRPEDIQDTPQPLQRGDRVQTGRGGSALLVLADGTEIRIRPKTEVVLFPDPQGGIDLPFGSISANVTPQSPSDPLTFFTPDGEVRVLGTELELLSTPAHSEVAVTEGRVRVTRNSDGSTVEVSMRQFLSVAGSGPLSVVDWPWPPNTWDVDFEQGLPRGWTGRMVHDALPESSRGAVAAVPEPRGQNPEFSIRSPIVPSGLFCWHDDSVLQLTFKVQPPGWFHIYLFARTYAQPQSSLAYCCVKPDLWQTRPGQWRTVSIPLSEFRLQTYVQGAPTLGRIPMQIAFSGESESVGFMIDRIQVIRGERSTFGLNHEVRTEASGR